MILGGNGKVHEIQREYDLFCYYYTLTGEVAQKVETQKSGILCLTEKNGIELLGKNPSDIINQVVATHGLFKSQTVR